MQNKRRKNILKNVDARLKISISAILISVTLFISNWVVLAVLAITVLTLASLAGLPISYCFKKLRIPAIMVVIMLIFQIVITPGQTAVLNAFLVFTRLMIVILCSFVLTATTNATEFILSATYFLKPLNKIGIKTDGFILMLRIITRFVPSLLEEANKILRAQASRGLDIKGASIWVKMRLIGALLLPVFVISIKRADDLSNSMAVRGFVLNQEKTSYRVFRKG